MIVAAIAANVPAAVATTLVVMGSGLVVLGALAHRFSGPVKMGPQGFEGELEKVRRMAQQLGLPDVVRDEALDRIEEDVEALEPRRGGLVEVLRERRRQEQAEEVEAEAARRRLLGGYLDSPEWREALQRNAEVVREQLRASGVEAARKALADIEIPRVSPEQVDHIRRSVRRARGEPVDGPDEAGSDR
jgi:hypothetical protein